ncbi:MAG: glycosyltransferase family 4 protein, partial [Endomicrobiales bacterium]
PWNILSLAWKMRAGGFHIVHTHSYAPGILGRLAAKCAGVPVVIHHQHTSVSSQMTPLQKRLERLATCLLTDKVIACSHASREFLLRERFGGAHNTAVIHNGIAEEFAEASGRAENVRKQWGITDDKIVLTVANLWPHKGHLFAVKALSSLLQRFPGTKWIFVGDGREKEAVLRLAQDTGIIGRIVMAGLQEDVRPYLEIADIFVLPSLHEAISLSIAEAMAKKLPVVASRVGGIPEIVEHGTTGFLVPPADPEALAAGIGELLGDGALRKRFGDNGHERFKKHFTLGTMADRLHHLYREAVQAKGLNARQ